MAISDDFTLDFDNKIISHSAGLTIYSVQQLYSFLQDTFDEQLQMDDTVPMSAQTPSEFTLINGWFIPDTTTHFLASGSIQTSNYSLDVYTMEGSEDTTFVLPDIGVEISGSTSADVGTLLDFQQDNHGNFKVYIRASSSNDVWTSPEQLEVSGGTGIMTMTKTSSTGDTVFTNLFTLGTLVAGTNTYILQSGSIIAENDNTGHTFGADAAAPYATPWWSTQFFDILIKSTEGGIEWDNSDFIVFAREYTNIYDHFEITAPGGRNAVPISIAADGFNTTVSSSISPLTSSVVITFFADSFTRDLDNGNGFQPYNIEIDCNTETLANVYEYTKYLNDRLFFGDIDTGTDFDPITGSVYLAFSESFAQVKGSPFGTFTGKFFAARGVFFENLNTADVKNFQLITSSGSTQDPPNTVAMTITATSASDRVGVFRVTPSTTDIILNEYQISQSDSIFSGAGTGIPSESLFFITSGSINIDVPKDSVIRTTSASVDYSFRFTDWTTGGSPISGSFFLSASISTSRDFPDEQDVWIPIIDDIAVTTSLSNTLVQSSDIDVLIRVRNGTPDFGILPFQLTSIIGSTGLSIAAIRTLDSINIS